MAHRIYIGIDNGVTGTIGWVGEKLAPGMMETPVKVEQSYTREKKNITRVDNPKLTDWLEGWLSVVDPQDVLVVIERPMVNPQRFVASCSALRALESTLVAIEFVGFPRMYIDSRAWQKVLLPKGTKGADELKSASMDIGARLFPSLDAIIHKHEDADGLLIAEWARREGL